MFETADKMRSVLLQPSPLKEGPLESTTPSERAEYVEYCTGAVLHISRTSRVLGSVFGFATSKDTVPLHIFFFLISGLD